MVGPGRAAGGVPRRSGLPLRQLREEGVRHAGEAARQGKRACDRLVNVASSVYGKVYFPVRSNGLKPLGRFLGAAWTDPQASGLQSLVWRHRWETDAGRAVQAVPAPVQPRGLRGRPAAGRSPGPDQAGRGVGPDDRVCQPAEAARDRNREGGPRAVRADLAGGCRGRRDEGPSECVQEIQKRKASRRRGGHERGIRPIRRIVPQGQPDGLVAAQAQMPQGSR